MKKISIRMISLPICFALVVWGAGNSTLGTLSTAGTVWTNGVVLPSGTEIRGGDHVRTNREALATLHQTAGGRVEVRPDSEVRFAGGTLELVHGAAGSSGMPVNIAGALVRPAGRQSGAWFVVAHRDGKQVVAAYRGDVVIDQSESGGEPLRVRSGMLAMAAGPERARPRDGEASEGADSEAECEGENRDDCRSEGATATAGGAAEAATTGGWTIGSLSHGQSVALAASLGAAAVGSTVAGIALTDSAASPTN